MPNERKRISIFPLPTVVLFPSLRIPLHIFEPRYRQMTEHAMRGDHQIGMVTVMPSRIDSMSGDPPVYDIGCAGTLCESQRLPDGRYNIVIEGTVRFRILDERPRSAARLYRVADVEFLDDPVATDLSALRTRVTEQIDRVVRLTGRSVGLPSDAFDDLDDTTFTHSLANGFNFEPSEKQGLLEANSVRERLERLSSLIDFALAELQAGRTPNSGTLQ